MQLRKSGSTILFLMSIIFFILSIISYISYKNDLSFLRSIVRTQISTETAPEVFESINHWIYQNKGFKKNPDYFLFKFLGTTPIQVLNKGGDCTDKSILLMAMLDSIGIDSTLVMLYDSDGGAPTHTVVEVRSGQFKAVADPVYDLVFPSQVSSGFYSIADLRENPARLLNRLDNLIQERGISNKIAYYRRYNETYQFATTINWNKNSTLKVMSGILGRMGIDARDIRRPHFLDDPKLFISSALFCISLLFIIFAFVFKTRKSAVHYVEP